eukprot:TRINITY_DN1614_c0_g1_i1.p1 TRINITY_DN1614_c0_g1~~TRINITY_DN1614_c0_g1_i1.p1  ORF type:complete len:288 (+),score=8.95 TRINITY_DN1614_c0_g1_i1:92-955(+)
MKSCEGKEGGQGHGVVMDFLKVVMGWQEMYRGWQHCAKSKIAKYQEKLRSVKWKNERAPRNQPYNPAPIEHLANILTHGILVIPTFWLSKNLLDSADSPQQYFSALVYGLVLTGLFTVSTVFHTVAAFSTNSIWRNLLHRADRAMIYLFIAGSYTPWLHLKSYTGISVELRWFVWVLSTLGILYQQLFHEKYKALETFFYVMIALLPSLAVFEMEELSGINELKMGGAIYMTGVVFFKSDGVIPLAHAIWHIHVVLGAMIHFYAVDSYLIGPVEEIAEIQAQAMGLK